MKKGVGIRWGVIGGVLGLVLLSMFVPLVFLLTGFHSNTGYVTTGQQTSSLGYDQSDASNTWNQTQVLQDPIVEAENKTVRRGAIPIDQGKNGPPVQPDSIVSTTNRAKVGGTVEISKHVKDVALDESGKSCELEFGSYCLWRQQHKEEMKDSTVKKLKDRLFVARAYFPSIAKLPKHDKLSREMKQNIQELERVLSETTTDAELPQQIGKKLQKMEASIAQAKSVVVDCNNVEKKFRQLVDLTEDEANFHMRQSAFLFQLAVQTMPKSLHCLYMRLTVEYFTHPSSYAMPSSVTDKFINSALHHYVIFSKNVLASSVVINSTVTHSEESRNQVFHVVTDGQNYFAMRVWFFKNTYKEATVQVLNIEELDLDYPDEATLLPEEFRVSFPSADKSSAQITTEYISIFSHSHYFLPDIFPHLKKVVVLGDDVVVQQDLSTLWSLNMEGMVNGAVQFCSVRLSRLKKYLGSSKNDFDGNSCAWMSGLNIIDLVRWREKDITETYRRLVSEQVKKGSSWGWKRRSALRASLLTFNDLIYGLDSVWSLSGLGHDYGVDIRDIKKAAVLHYNGNMKPWLDVGISKYRHHWKRYMNPYDELLSECNVNP